MECVFIVLVGNLDLGMKKKLLSPDFQPLLWQRLLGRVREGMEDDTVRIFVGKLVFGMMRLVSAQFQILYFKLIWKQNLDILDYSN